MIYTYLGLIKSPRTNRSIRYRRVPSKGPFARWPPDWCGKRWKADSGGGRPFGGGWWYVALGKPDSPRRTGFETQV